MEHYSYIESEWLTFKLGRSRTRKSHENDGLVLGTGKYSIDLDAIFVVRGDWP